MLMYSPWPSHPHISDWEQTEEARSLVKEVEEAVGKIHKFVGNIRQSTFLPDFDKNAVVAYWELKRSNAVTTSQTVPSSPPPERTFARSSKTENLQRFRESLLGLHPRIKVRPVLLEAEGICKLVMTFRTPDNTTSFYGGTGWLIDNETIITAGHNLYSPQEKSYAEKVTAYVGATKGKTHPIRAETREGRFAAVHWGYYTAKLKQNDMAVIKLAKGFDHVTAIVPKAAPIRATMLIEVVGYPGDLGVKGKGEGWVMYRSRGTKSYDLEKDEFLICHQCDTFGGNSGGPILEVDKDGKFQAIGIHCYGASDGELWNSGTPLGHNANDIDAFLEAMGIAENGVTVAKDPRSSTDSGQSSVVPGMIKVTVSY
ncbi:trypsin-like serine protease [Aulographum hederae CBS 113979]|uniref:Trypsin-like serine protease n=1 Tax=Aulographum hederae CBS 113979 TaxID=1176131 RepID=A0A6G1H223_9PEZI|nr:trypsin-like serine protease [Aulographum hederae CBS 113979]